MQASRAQKHVCFYSNKCQWSRAFITELSKTPYKEEFMFVCVDPSDTRPKLPGFLKKVPTILIRGENEPRTDGDVMNWLSERRMRDSGAGGGAQASAQGNDPAEYYSCEMDAMGQDMYSFIDSDTSTNGNGGNRIQQTFSFINDSINTSQGSTAQERSMPVSAHDPKRSKKEEMFDKQMEMYMKSRDAGMPQMIPRT